MLSVKNDRVYTYADYLKMDENVRCEIVDGILFMMAQLSRLHQKVFRQLFILFGNYLSGKPCELYSAPFGVVFMKKEPVFDLVLEDKNPSEYETDAAKSKWVVEPDITIVCDKSKLTDEGCVGAPDFIVEILSPSTQLWDLRFKRFLYETNGVREYWVVDIGKQRVIQWILFERGAYEVQHLYTFQDPVPCLVLEGCVVDFLLIDLT